MSCEPPKPLWRAGFLRPVNAVLWIAGIACMVISTFLSSGLAGLLPQTGGILFLIGTSNGAISAHGLGSLLNLVNGSRDRVESLTKECTDQQARMESIAELLCSETARAHRTVELTTTDVARTWTRGIGWPFTLFLLCQTIAHAFTQNEIFDPPGTAADPERMRQAILVLHRSCKVPAADIARMLDRPVAEIRAVAGVPTPGAVP